MGFLSLLAWGVYGLLNVNDKMKKSNIYDRRKNEAIQKGYCVFMDGEGKFYSTRTEERVYEAYNYDLKRSVWYSLYGEKRIVEDPQKEFYENQEKEWDKIRETALQLKGINYRCYGFFDVQQRVYKYKKIDTQQYFYLLYDKNIEQYIVKWEDEIGWHRQEINANQYWYLELIQPAGHNKVIEILDYEKNIEQY